MQAPAVITPPYRLVFRLEIANRPGMFARVATTIGARGCSLGAIDLVEATPQTHVRDVTVDKDVVPTIVRSVAAATAAAGLSRRTALADA